jgi:Fe-S cluster assembly ATP-binding protein
MDKLEIKNLHVSVEEKEILKGVNLVVKSGEMHAIMGPNGSGKSTLCFTLMGHPRYKITKGDILMNGKSVLEMSTDKRAKLGMFLGFQYPHEIPGITFGNFLRLASNNLKLGKPMGPMEFYPVLKNEFKSLKMDESFIGRGLNEGFSGGEKKRAEIAQMSILKPKIAILDEIDSGLDIDGVKTIAQGIGAVYKKQKNGLLVITHYQRILNFLKPDFVHVMSGGKIIQSGGKELAKKLEKGGYDSLKIKAKKTIKG